MSRWTRPQWVAICRFWAEHQPLLDVHHHDGTWAMVAPLEPVALHLPPGVRTPEAPTKAEAEKAYRDLCNHYLEQRAGLRRQRVDRWGNWLSWTDYWPRYAEGWLGVAMEERWRLDWTAERLRITLFPWDELVTVESRSPALAFQRAAWATVEGRRIGREREGLEQRGTPPLAGSGTPHPPAHYRRPHSSVEEGE